MKKILFSAVLSAILFSHQLLWAGTTYSHPAKDPVFSISFPDTWEADIQGEEISVTSPNGNIEIEIWPIDVEEYDDDMSAALIASAEEVDEIIKEYASHFKSEGEANTYELNDISFLEVAGKGTLRETNTEALISATFFSPDEDSLYVMMFWGDAKATQARMEDLQAIMTSITSYAE